MTREGIIENLVAERITVLTQQKSRLEEQLTNHTGNETELPEAFADQRREKLAEIIKELNLLDDETLVIRTGNVNTGD